MGARIGNTLLIGYHIWLIFDLVVSLSVGMQGGGPHTPIRVGTSLNSNLVITTKRGGSGTAFHLYRLD